MIYTAEQAKKYRECDENPDTTVKHFGNTIKGICSKLPKRSVVLDLGCGTGRYFRYVSKRHILYGVDPSSTMVKEAGNPVGGRTADYVWEVSAKEFTGAFDVRFVYCVGVLAEHIGLTYELLNDIKGWLVGDGILYFTAEKTKDGKPTTINEEKLDSLMYESKFEKWDITEWNTDTEHFKGTHFEVIAE